MIINLIVGVYISIIRIPIKGGMTIPNTRSLDPGSYALCIHREKCADLMVNLQKSSDQGVSGYLLYRGDDKLPSLMGIIIRYNKPLEESLLNNQYNRK